MRRLVALLLLLVTASLVTRYGGSGSDPRSIGFAFGFALIAAALAGDLFERIRLPRITGYLVFGVVCGPFVANIISRPMARELTIVNGLAIALIAFMAGLELNFQRLLPRLRAIVALGGIQLGLMYTGLFALGWLAWPWLPLMPEATGLARVTLAALLATLVVSFSPTVTIAVIADSRARGPLSELVLALVVIADLALIVLFTLAMQAVRWTLGAMPTEEDVSLLARLAWEIFGSFAFGAIVGSLFAFYLRLVGTRSHDHAARPLRRPQPGRRGVPLRAAARRARGRARRRKHRAAEWRRAEGRGRTRRAAGARGVLRGGRRVAAPRCAQLDRVDCGGGVGGALRVHPRRRLSRHARAACPASRRKWRDSRGWASSRRPA